MFRATMGRALGFNGSSPRSRLNRERALTDSKADVRACEKERRRKARRKNEIGARRALRSIAARAHRRMYARMSRQRLEYL